MSNSNVLPPPLEPDVTLDSWQGFVAKKELKNVVFGNATKYYKFINALKEKDEDFNKVFMEYEKKHDLPEDVVTMILTACRFQRIRYEHRTYR